MIERLLEAYETEIVNNNPSLLKRIKEMEHIRKIIICINVAFILAILVMAYCNKYVAFILVILLIVIIDIETIIMERNRHKKWKENIVQYNLELNQIASLLKKKEFNLYEKTKIKQLISKLYRKIDYDIQADSHKKEEKKSFLFTYIVPVITYFVGQLNPLDSLSKSNIIAIGILIVGMIYVVRYDYNQTLEIIKALKWNMTEKGKEFLPKLQDLLDRDFDIEPEDILPFK